MYFRRNEKLVQLNVVYIRNDVRQEVIKKVLENFAGLLLRMAFFANGTTTNQHGKHVVELFGGAFKCTLPKNAHDMSKFREIPDNQEVFCHESTDQSYMFDILEYQEEELGEQAIRCHYNDLADCNESNDETEVSLVEAIPKELIKLKRCSEVWFLSGSQHVAKFNETDAKNVLQIFMVLYRLPEFGTDMIVVMNNPVVISNESSSITTSAHNGWTLETFREMACTLQLMDPSIFVT